MSLSNWYFNFKKRVKYQLLKLINQKDFGYQKSRRGNSSLGYKTTDFCFVLILMQSSSAVEQETVNLLVVGSNPTFAAILIKIEIFHVSERF